MRYRRPNVSRTDTDQLARDLGLSEWGSKRLYCELCRSLYEYEIDKALSDNPTKPQAIARILGELERSFERVVTFAMSQSRGELYARRELIAWAEELLRRRRPGKDSQLVQSLGLEPSPIEGTHDLDYGLFAKLAQWLWASQGMLRAVRSTRLRMVRLKRSRPTAWQILVCEKLPEIYRRRTGNEIIPRWNDEEEVWRGAEFIGDALKAMNLKSMTSAAFERSRSRHWKGYPDLKRQKKRHRS